MLRLLPRKTMLLSLRPCGVAGVSTLSPSINSTGYRNHFTLGTMQGSFLKIDKSRGHRAFSSASGDLGGTRSNQSGSVIEFSQSENGKFGFTVNLRGGWLTGQYIEEEYSDEALVANWIRTPNQQDCVQHLEPIHVGQDRITRKNENPERGPSFDDPEPKGWLLAY